MKIKFYRIDHILDDIYEFSVGLEYVSRTVQIFVSLGKFDYVLHIRR